MRIALTASAVSLLLAAAFSSACGAGSPATLPTPVLPTSAVATPTRQPTPTGSVTQGATPTRVGGTPSVQPSPTVSASATSSAGSPSADALTQALAAAKITATRTGQAVSCGNGPASSGQVWQASGQDGQQQFVLWIYPDHASLEVDWVADIGKAPQPRQDGCVSGGSVSWNGNLVLYVQGRDIGTLTAAIRDAFLSLGN